MLLSSEPLERMGTSAGKPVLTEECIQTLIERSGMERSQIENYFSYFLSINSDGKIDRKEFRKVLSIAEPSKDTQKMEDHVFRIFDTDGSGSIDFTEFCVVYHTITEGAPDKCLKNLFRVFDFNNDGEISHAEMKMLMKDMYVLLQAEETEMSEETIIKSTFAEMDRDRDGRITEEEFVSACLRHSTFSDLLTSQIVNMF